MLHHTAYQTVFSDRVLCSVHVFCTDYPFKMISRHKTDHHINRNTLCCSQYHDKQPYYEVSENVKLHNNAISSF